MSWQEGCGSENAPPACVGCSGGRRHPLLCRPPEGLGPAPAARPTPASPPPPSPGRGREVLVARGPILSAARCLLSVPGGSRSSPRSQEPSTAPSRWEAVWQDIREERHFLLSRQLQLLTRPLCQHAAAPTSRSFSPPSSSCVCPSGLCSTHIPTALQPKLAPAATSVPEQASAWVIL